MNEVWRNPWMLQAVELAGQAAAQGEIPVGAVVVRDGGVIGRGYNRRETGGDPTAHAEIEAIREAAACLGDWRLTRCRLYVTLEPCPMCCGAILNARISALYFGAYDLRYGAVCSALRMTELPGFPPLEWYGGIHEKECRSLLSEFFTALRDVP